MRIPDVRYAYYNATVVTRVMDIIGSPAAHVVLPCKQFQALAFKQINITVTYPYIINVI